ncbi:histidine phosphatase family protein [Neobacillus sp. D3-1R]|uniref:histidine phosphatase family protein n=1 Tax=Neobacillus sp. D3-1R TaxID=3445778 RepID=UPI003F9FD4A4
MIKTIYFVRHAKANGQEVDAPLTDKGKEQALKLVDFFASKPIGKIYSSPFKRAIATIQPLADFKGLSIVEDSRLSERVLSGVPLADWMDKLKQSFQDFDLVFEGGESQSSGMKRAISILEEVLSSKDDHIILVSHGNLTTLLIRYFNENFGYDELMGMSNPDVFEFVVSDEKTLLRRIWADID